MLKSIRNPDLPFSAALLAGGRSTRMGRDKASVEFAGQPLWRRQLATLRATGAGELLISGRADGPFADAGLPIVADFTPDAGPLGALEAILSRAVNSHVLVLAIDLPEMRADFLAELAETALARNATVVPQIDGHFEPLAAVYAKELLPLVTEALQSADRSMQSLLRHAQKLGRVTVRPVAENERALFRNVNSPADLA